LAVSIPPTDAQAHPGGVVLAGAGSMSGRDVRLVASLVDAWIYVLVEVAAGYLSFVPTWVPITLYIALQGVLLVKRGQTLGKLLQGIKIVDHRTKDRAGFAKVFLVRTGIQWAFVWIPALFTLLSAALITGGGMGVGSGLIALGVAGLVSSLLALFALIDILFIYSADYRCLHDRMAGTSVVGARGRILRDKIIYWIVISILLVVIVGGAAMIGNGAMSL
jgi:hypothetical protein